MTFRDYLIKRREALLIELRAIEKLLNNRTKQELAQAGHAAGLALVREEVDMEEPMV